MFRQHHKTTIKPIIIQQITNPDNQNQPTNAVYDEPVIDFNDLLNLPGNNDTNKDNQPEESSDAKTEENTQNTETTKATENDSTHEEQSTTHADPDGPGWSDWIIP